MSIPLGGNSKVIFNLKDGSGESAQDNKVSFTYTNPTNAQMNSYLAKTATMMKVADTEGGLKELLEFRCGAAMEIVVDVDGFSVGGDGSDVMEAMREYGSDYLNMLAQHVFDGRNRTVTLDVGKSEPESPSSGPAKSAQKKSRRVPGSKK